MNRLLKFKINNNGSYFAFMALLYVVSPLVCFIVALFYFKKTVSQFFFVAFAFYFGFQLGANLDLRLHWDTYQLFFGRSLGDMYTNPIVLYQGQEPYHILLKWVLSRFGVSERIFSGVVCALYTIFVITFIRQYKSFYKENVPALNLLVLAVIVVTVEFYWYFGIRFWTSGFVFMIFYSRYIITGKKRFLWLSATATLFHVAMATPVCVAIGIEIIRDNRIVEYVVLAISFVVRFVGFQFDRFMQKNPLVQSFYKDNYQKDFYIEAINKVTQEKYNNANLVYTLRIPLMLTFFFFLVAFLWTRNKHVMKSYPKLFGMVLMMLAVSNFGVSDYVFYERFIKLTALLAYCWLFLVLLDPANVWLSNHLFIKVILVFVVLMSILIALVQQRMIISDLALWFGNFFYLVPLNELEIGFKN